MRVPLADSPEEPLGASQRIDLVRRNYNQWVADQTLEDYALRFTAKSARRWSAAQVANTALGADLRFSPSRRSGARSR